jgi:hypothetical protein
MAIALIEGEKLLPVPRSAPRLRASGTRAI